VADPKHPGTLYVGTSGGVYKSVNHAEHWQSVNTGLGIEAVGGALSHGVNALVLHPEETTTLYIGTTRGLFMSANGGASWTQSQTIPAGNIAALAIDPREPSVIYAGGGGIFKTTDRGATWVAMSTGLTNNAVRVLAIDPQAPQTLYVGTNGGLFKTTDGGQRWEAKLLGGGGG
jgi:photosystem II stability/assembly factor-like uncharacterized protein